MKTILVSGGTGFIGSHTCVELIEAGYDVAVFDNLSNSKTESLNRIEQITGVRPRFYQVDMLDREGLDSIFEQEDIEAVIHFAGLKAVGESVAKPGKKPKNSEFLTGVNPIFTTFNIDEANRQMYIYIERIGTGADQIKAGLYRISLEDLIAFGTGSDIPTLKSKLQLIDGAPVKYEGSSTNEHVGISQLCFDENKQYMYWCYRATSAEEAEKTEAQKEDDQLLGRYYWAEKFDAANPLHQSGIKRIKLGEANPVVEMVIPGAVGYGCVPVKFEGSDKPAGVNDIVADVNAADITVTADAIIANSDVTVKVYDMNGANVLSVSLRAGQSVATDGLGHGAFIAVANGAATKFVR